MLEKLNIKVVISALFLLLGLSITPSINPQSNIVPDVPARFAAIPTESIDLKQLHCMAKNIFYEAGSESIKGQAAVARVVLNRVAHGFGKTPCAVIYQATNTENGKVCQFSWVCEGKGEPNKNDYRYKVAKQVAYDIMVHDKYNDVVPKSTLFFHNLSVNPLWPYVEVIRIGNHVFYSKSKKKNYQPKLYKEINEEAI